MAEEKAKEEARIRRQAEIEQVKLEKASKIAEKEKLKYDQQL